MYAAGSSGSPSKHGDGAAVDRSADGTQLRPGLERSIQCGQRDPLSQWQLQFNFCTKIFDQRSLALILYRSLYLTQERSFISMIFFLTFIFCT